MTLTKRGLVSIVAASVSIHTRHSTSIAILLGCSGEMYAVFEYMGSLLHAVNILDTKNLVKNTYAVCAADVSIFMILVQYSLPCWNFYSSCIIFC